MGSLINWFERVGPFRGLGNSGAVANARRMCDERRRAEAVTDAALKSIARRSAGPKSAERKSA